VTAFERGLDWIVERVVKVCEYLAIAIGGWVAVSLVVGVFFRYVLNSSLIWVDEIGSLLLVWMMLAVSPIGFHRYIHISVEVVVERLPRRGRVVLGVFMNLCSILLFGIIGYYGVFLAIDEFGTDLASMFIKRGWFTSFMPIASAAVLLVCINNILKILREGNFTAFSGGSTE
jgi:TRAP-type C4-dicarboxylate transport system permease small subunit